MRAIFLFIFLLPLTCLAQVSISGKVIDNSDKGPIPNASVFLANATIGEQSAPDGTFHLKNIKPGKYELVVSMIGFDTYHQNITVENANIVLPDIEITAKANALKEVKITADQNTDPNRNRYLDWFTDEFIGTSDIARQCKIVNPEVLNFSYDNGKGILTASSDGFLIIENKALGYTVNYLLSNFKLNNKDIYNKEVHYDGSVFFKEMTGKPSQMSDWETKRQEVYENSQMHFFRAVLKNNIEQEGFRIYQIAVKPNLQRPDQRVIDAELNYYQNAASTVSHRRDSLAYWLKKSKLPKSFQTLMHYPLTKKDILYNTDQTGSYALSCDNDALYVAYNKSRHFRIYNNVEHLEPTNTDITIINFTEPYALVDANGGIANPNSLAFNGVWAHKRIGDLLPVNYDPAVNEEEKTDSTVTKNVISKLTNYFASHITEKAYLHFDKAYYAAGDTIYFKAYVTNGEGNQLSGLSNVLHVDLINSASHLDQSIKLKLNNGLAWGEFTLPDSLPGGNYIIRAYTQLMRNNEEAGYFARVIPVSAVKKTFVSANVTTKPAQNPSQKVDIQFFPEGGDLLAGTRSKVAFKAVGVNGLGVNVKGTIVDNDDNEVATFASTHLGMGYFYLEPRENKTYMAKIVYADGSQAGFDLPKVQTKGIVLSISNGTSEQSQVIINTSKAYYHDNRNKDYTLFVYSAGEVTSYITKLKEPTVSVSVPNAQLRTGVVRATLFSPEGEPLSERLWFVKNHDLLTLQVNSDKSSYTKREKVKINLNAVQNGRPVSGHFSVTVVDDNQVPVNEDSEHTILTDLLLTSELKGYIEKPNYYFANNSKEVDDSLDILMLTQGYRRFEWKEVIGNKPEQVLAYKAEKSLELEGLIKSMTGKPKSDEELILIDTKDNLLMDTLSDKSGEFKFTGIDVTDTPFMAIHTKSKGRAEDAKIEIRQTEIPPLSQSVINLKAGNDTLSQQVVTQMQDKFVSTNKGGIKLKEIKIKGYKPPKPDIPNSANLNGPGNADYVLMGDKLEDCVTLDCLYGKIPGTISRGGKLYLSRSKWVQLNGEPPPPMAVIIDGSVFPQDISRQGFTNTKVFDNINIHDIYSIEVLESGNYLAMYGSNAPGGALVITTKRGGENRNKITSAPGWISFPFNGFYKSREFYSPKYDHPMENDNHKDLRTTVYWKPELLTDKDGNASFEYYNADGHGTYRVIVEGIDGSGDIGRLLYRYKVE